MAIASSAATKLYYIEEEADGTIDATAPNFKELRYVDHSLQKTSERISGDEKIAGRHKSADRRGVGSISGDLNCLLSHGSHDDLIEAAFMGTWATNVLKTGATRRTFSVLEHHSDSGIDQWYRYAGCEMSTFGIDGKIKDKIDLKFGIVGKSLAKYTLPGDEVLVAAPTENFMTTLDGSLSVAGSPYGFATSLTFDLNNGLEAIYALFDPDAVGVVDDTITAEGGLDAYFTSVALYDRFLDDTDTLLSAVLSDGTNTYTFKVPKAVWVEGTKAPSGKQVVTSMKYSAAYEAGDASEFMITRSA